MNTRLELLQKEAREKFDKKYGWLPQDAFLDDLITHVYQQAIEDAKGAVPEGRFSNSMADWSEVNGWNDCRAEAITALDKLKEV